MCECLFKYLGFILVAGILILSFIFAFFKYFEYDYQNNLIISEIQKNLNEKLINKISFRKSCQYNEEKLNLGVWDGTSEGCDCDGIIFKEKCSDDHVETGCKSLFANAPINYTIFNSSNICVERAKLDYMELLKSDLVVSKDEECPVNHKLCGIIDTLGRKLCFKNEDTCPLNTNDFKQKIFDLNSEALSFFIEKHYTNISNTDGLLLSVIKVGQYLPCINPLEKFWDYHYDLEPEDQRCTTKIKEKLYDERYIQLPYSPINKLQLYNENSITEKLKDISEINLNEIKNDEIFLFGRNFIGFNLKDGEIFRNNYNNLISKQNLSNDSNFSLKIFFIILIGSLAVCFIMKIIVKMEINGIVINLETISKISAFIFVFSLPLSPIFLMIIFIILLHCNVKINSILNMINGDEYTNEIIKQLKEEISINFNYPLTIIIITPFIFISLCYSMLKVGKEEEEKSMLMTNPTNNSLNEEENEESE